MQLKHFSSFELNQPSSIISQVDCYTNVLPSSSFSAVPTFSDNQEISYIDLEVKSLTVPNSTMIQDSSNIVNKSKLTSNNLPLRYYIQYFIKSDYNRNCWKRKYKNCTNHLMDQKLWNMMNSLKDDIKKLTKATVPTLGMSNDLEDKIFLEKFPFSKKEDILEFEKLLQIDNIDREKLKIMFCSIGGNDGKSHLRRVLSKVFTNKLASIEYSADIRPIDDTLYETIGNKDKNQDLVQQIRKWAVQFNVSHGCVNEMLNILRNTGQEVPKDILHEHKSVRTILEIKNGPFINELNHILAYGIQINNRQINFEVTHIVADAPAKAFLLNVKNHNGYFACTPCEVEGEYLDRICFLDVSSPLRTNNSFRLKSNAEYHKDGFSPLIDLPIDITKCVVLDYMHCVCQGVMKILLDFWVKEKKPIRIILCSDKIFNTLSDLASKLLIEFVQNYSYIYGSKFVSYNVHSLIHLSFFCFKYENYLQILKKSMKCCRFPLSEILNKVLASEGEELRTPLNNLNLCTIKSFKIDKKLSDFRFTYFKKITLKSNNYSLSCDNVKDRCIILENEDIVMIKSIYKFSGGLWCSNYLYKTCWVYHNGYNVYHLLSHFEVIILGKLNSLIICNGDLLAIIRGLYFRMQVITLCYFYPLNLCVCY
ncbi:hypothetical protein QTP88_010775 [Uroleucon formosanum]